MMRTGKISSVVLVEGDSDARVYEGLFDRALSSIVAAGGREKTIEALIRLEREGIRGVLAVVDADYDRAEQRGKYSENCFLTDGHDLEGMILSTGTLNRVVAEMGAEGEIGTSKGSILEWLLENSEVIGILRWRKVTKEGAGRELDVNVSDIDRSFDAGSMVVRKEKLLWKVSDRNGLGRDGVGKLKEMVERVRGQGIDKREVCGGHDLTRVLWLGLKKGFGAGRGKGLSHAALEGSLRLAYRREDFSETALCGELKSWEKKGTDFRLFSG